MNPSVEIEHNVCRRCHTSETVRFRPKNLGCKRCINTAQIVAKRLRLGEITTAEAIIVHPYARIVHKIYDEEIVNFEHKGILSIDQDIIDSIV